MAKKLKTYFTSVFMENNIYKNRNTGEPRVHCQREEKYTSGGIKDPVNG